MHFLFFDDAPLIKSIGISCIRVYSLFLHCFKFDLEEKPGDKHFAFEPIGDTYRDTAVAVAEVEDGSIPNAQKDVVLALL